VDESRLRSGDSSIRFYRDRWSARMLFFDDDDDDDRRTTYTDTHVHTAHEPARVETERPGDAVFVPSLRRNARARATFSSVGRRCTRGRPRGQWTVGWACLAATRRRAGRPARHHFAAPPTGAVDRPHRPSPTHARTHARTPSGRPFARRLFPVRIWGAREPPEETARLPVNDDICRLLNRTG